MEHTLKRKANEEGSSGPEKRRKKAWRVPRTRESTTPQSRSIQPGDSGIWATCSKGREAKCIGELRDLFAEHADKLYAESSADGESRTTAADTGIEGDIAAEIIDLQQSKASQLFTPLRVDVQCVVFMKTEAPVEPVAFVKSICQDALDSPAQKRTRFVQRLSPMTLIGRASEEGLEKVAQEVVAPHFHRQADVPRKFAIRPTLRNHNVLSRESIINQVARIVGPGHRVDLKDYDLLIVVEVYQNICGVSVVDRSFDAMKRYNLAEIFAPTPRQ